MVSIDIFSARLRPLPGDGGWLCRLPGAVLWAPGTRDEGAELVAVAMAAPSPAELLGRVASRLADPKGALWGPFAIVAQRGPDLVAVVHGPVELTVEHEGQETRLYGGEEVGSWLNRLVKAPMSARAGTGALPGDDRISDLRQGVVRAAGFALGSPAASSQGTGAAASQGAAGTGGAAASRAPARAASNEVPDSDEFFDAESPTIVEQPLVADVTVIDAEGAGAPGPDGPGAALGRLTWDSGEVHDLSGPVLVGRDVSADQAVLNGRLAPVVPSGQNDSMSRVHAEISLRGSEVVVVDRGSTNGTFVWDETAKAWQRLEVGEAHVVRPGTVLAFGERTATFGPVHAPVR